MFQIVSPCVYSDMFSGSITFHKNNLNIFITSIDGNFSVSDGIHTSLCTPGNYLYATKYDTLTIYSDKCRLVIVSYKSLPTDQNSSFTEFIIDNDQNKLKHLYEASVLSLSSGIKRNCKLYSLIYSLLSCHEESLNTEIQKIRPGLEMLEDNFLENTPIELYAEKCDLSENRFRSIFKNIYGVSPVEYRSRLRLERAKELIENLSIPVTMAAEATGFKSSSYFCRLYKQIYGITPGTGKR